MQNRIFSRILHLIAAAALGTFIYSPWRSNPTFDFWMSYGVFPLLALTGIWMWQAPRLKKLFKPAAVNSPTAAKAKAS